MTIPAIESPRARALIFIYEGFGRLGIDQSADQSADQLPRQRPRITAKPSSALHGQAQHTLAHANALFESHQSREASGMETPPQR